MLLIVVTNTMRVQWCVLLKSLCSRLWTDSYDKEESNELKVENNVVGGRKLQNSPWR